MSFYISKERLRLLTNINDLYIRYNSNCCLCNGIPQHTIETFPDFGIRYCNRCIREEERPIVEYLLNVKNGSVPLNVVKRTVPEENDENGLCMWPLERRNQPDVFKIDKLLHHLQIDNGPPRLNILRSNGTVEKDWIFPYHKDIKIHLKNGKMGILVRGNSGVEKLCSVEDLWKYNPTLEAYFRKLSYKICLYDIPTLPEQLKERIQAFNTHIQNHIRKLFGGENKDVYNTSLSYMPDDVAHIVAKETGTVCVEMVSVIVE